LHRNKGFYSFVSLFKFSLNKNKNEMKKAILIFTVLLMSAVIGFAQTGTIKGTVRTSSGGSAEFVNVALKGLSKGAATRKDGSYEILEVRPGSYKLVATFIGFQTQEKQVQLESGQTLTVDFTLDKVSAALEEIEVTENRLQVKESGYVSKMPLKNMENAQVYNVITRGLLDDQVLFSVDDALRNAPGLTKMWGATGRSGDGGGYYNARGFILQSQLRNGIAGNVSARIDAVNLERIEVIKGPSATLFGNSLTSYGGLINRVTKKPYEKAGAEITLSGGTYDLYRLSADVNTPLDKGKKLLFRLNTAYHHEGTFRDNGYNKNLAVAPGLLYKPNERLSAWVDMEYYQGRNVGMPIFFFDYLNPVSLLGASRADQLEIDYHKAYSSGDISQQYRNMNYFGQISYKISDKWSSQTNFTSTSSFSDGPYPYFYLIPDAAITGDSTDRGSGYISRNDQSTRDSRDHTLEVQQNFNGDFKIGSHRNRVVLGMDFFRKNSNQLFVGNTLDTIPASGNTPLYGNFTRENLDALYAAKGIAFSYPIRYKANTYSAYIADVFSITDRLLVLGALRFDRFLTKADEEDATGKGSFNQNAVSPKLGLVYQPIKDRLSLFANYQNGFTNINGKDFEGKAFRPEQANQLEGGVKLDAFNGNLSGTVSVYHIEVKDIVRPDIAHPSFSIQDGTQISRGFEAEVLASPLPGLNIIAGFAFNSSKFEKSYADVEGRRPATAGPPHSANLWVSYRLPDTWLKGLGFGFGGNYAGDNKVVNSLSQGEFILPAFTVLNASAFYEYSRFRFSVKSDNLTNRKYYIGYTTVNPQNLRTVTAAVSCRF
jgi:iron complex outermembrane recepter protein